MPRGIVRPKLRKLISHSAKYKFHAVFLRFSMDSDWSIFMKISLTKVILSIQHGGKIGQDHDCALLDHETGKLKDGPDFMLSVQK